MTALIARDDVRPRRFLRDLVVGGDETIVRALQDDAIVEIMLNPDGSVWTDVLGAGLVETSMRIAPDAAAGIVSAIAGHLGRYVNENLPILEATVPHLHVRVTAVIAPVSGNAMFAIRKHLALAWTLPEHVAKGTLTASQADLLGQAIVARRSILVAGGVGSGKTTLANALLRQIGASERIVVLESTPELRLDGNHFVALATDETNGIDLRALLRVTLRLRPDRIIVGEIRGSEAHDYLKALNTGHPGGIATIHANSAAMALDRLEECLAEAGAFVRQQRIADAIDLLVYMECRHVTEILRVDGWTDGQYATSRM